MNNHYPSQSTTEQNSQTIVL